MVVIFSIKSFVLTFQPTCSQLKFNLPCASKSLWVIVWFVKSLTFLYFHHSMTCQGRCLFFSCLYIFWMYKNIFCILLSKTSSYPIHQNIFCFKQMMLLYVPTDFHLIQDVCVPLSRLAECITKSKQELDASSLLWYVIMKLFRQFRIN